MDNERIFSQMIHRAMTDHHIPALGVLLSQKGVPLVSKGYGVANLELGVEATANTVFEIASITKLFTAQAIKLLENKKRLTLNDYICAHLPQLPVMWQAAQIRHLLTHTSGIPNYTDNPTYWQTTRLDISREEILNLVLEQPLKFEPGTNWEYSNTGYYLLGLLIEKLSQQNYAQFLTDNIFQPLNMHNTWLNDPHEIVQERAAGYVWQNTERKWRNKEYYSPSGTYAAGAILTSVNDLVKWVGAFYSNAILNPQLQSEMWSPLNPVTEGEQRLGFRMGYGWFRFDKLKSLPETWVGHNGRVKGFSSTLVHLVEKQLTLILLSNREDFDAIEQLANDVLYRVVSDKLFA